MSGVVRLERPSASSRCDDAQNIVSRTADASRRLVATSGHSSRTWAYARTRNAGSPGSRPRLDLMNVRGAESDSSRFPHSHDIRTECAIRYPNSGVLQFLIHYCTMREQPKTVTTHPEGQRDRPDEAPATSRLSGLVLTPTARGWKMRVTPSVRLRCPALMRPHPALDGVSCLEWTR